MMVYEQSVADFLVYNTGDLEWDAFAHENFEDFFVGTANDR